MLKSAISGFALAFSLLTAGAAFAAATPTLHQIYEAAQAGRLNEAQGMIQQVLKEHPDSAKAHYVDAELLMKAGRSIDARQELNTAERLEPGLSFAKPQEVQNLKARIGETYANPAPMTSTQAGFPWGWLFLGVGVIVMIPIIRRLFTKPNASPAAYPVNYQTGFPPAGGLSAAGGSYAPMAPSAPGMGSSIMSGLATGAALGAGMVAGEELVRHFTDGNPNLASSAQATPSSWDTQSDNMGGTDFGIADNSSWDDSANIADISGGDDWN